MTRVATANPNTIVVLNSDSPVEVPWADETKTVTFNLDWRAFAFYDPLAHDWVVEAGNFGVFVGASSQDIRLRTQLTRSGMAETNTGSDAAQLSTVAT